MEDVVYKVITAFLFFTRWLVGALVTFKLQAIISKTFVIQRLYVPVDSSLLHQN